MSTTNQKGNTDEIRKQELLSLVAKGSTERAIFDELRHLNEAEAKSRLERKAQVDGLVRRIADLGVRLSEIADAFPDDQIRELVLSRGISQRKRRGTGTRRTAAHALRKDGEVLIEALNPKGKGNAATYNRGQRLPRRVPMAFKALLDGGDANLGVALAKRFTEAGKAYFSTDQGKQDLAEFTQFVRDGKPASRSRARR